MLARRIEPQAEAMKTLATRHCDRAIEYSSPNDLFHRVLGRNPLRLLWIFNTELADMRLMTLVIASSLAVATAACATNRTDLTETGAVDVEIDGGLRSAVRYVNVYFDDQDGETVIRGKVSDTGFYPHYVKHVHVKVVLPDNKLILEERPRLIWQTRPQKRGKQAGSTCSGRFTVRLPQAVPSGTVVQVVYHDRLHPGANSAG